MEMGVIHLFMNHSTPLTSEEDAYGQMLWTYYEGEEVYEIAERDDGYISASPLPKIYFSEYEKWPSIEREAMAFIKGKVLDVGCGAGRHSLYLQKKGFDVIGIDSSPLAVKVCRLRGVEKAEVLAVEDVDSPPASFDTIIMMVNNFGLVGTPTKAQGLLEKFYTTTSTDSLIIAQTLDPYKTQQPYHLEDHRFNKERGRMGGQVRIRIRFRKCLGRWFDLLMVSQEEMRQILKETKWKIKKFIECEGANYIAVIGK